jgi:hypothetical protein
VQLQVQAAVTGRWLDCCLHAAVVISVTAGKLESWLPVASCWLSGCCTHVCCLSWTTITLVSSCQENQQLCYRVITGRQFKSYSFGRTAATDSVLSLRMHVLTGAAGFLLTLCPARPGVMPLSKTMINFACRQAHQSHAKLASGGCCLPGKPVGSAGHS